MKPVDLERERRLAELLAGAVDLPAAERAAHLRAECDDPKLVAAALELLADGDPTQAFLASPLPAMAIPLGDQETVSPERAPVTGGQRIGPYRLLRVLGEGGMGVVWEAEQSEPVRRRVALKIMKPGMASWAVVTRFEAERQALAVMSHPAIAKVFDAGETEEHQPFFVMELVAGLPINEYCDRERLRTDERLRLFQSVCEGVQHAHQKAIIHRDLKPSNILVVKHDGFAQPKIIDFGVAKAMAQPLIDKALATHVGVLIGTPAYMSPEQADMSEGGVDTRTDVYSLGVVLYQLLTGALPFDPKQLETPSYELIRRTIREVDPPRPSTKVSTLGEQSEEIAALRRVRPKELGHELEGDLDWIVMKAMAKEPDRRYASARELRIDLERYLSQQPVEARPPTATYRMRKFVGRHRTAAVASLAVAAALVLGIVGTAAGLVRARRQAERADRERAAARQISAFLTGLFEVSDPGEARGNTVTARELLDRAAADLTGGELAGQPEERARLSLVIGNIYEQLGLYEQAIPLQEQAVALMKREPDASPADLSSALSSLSHIHTRQQRFNQAEALEREALAIREKAFGPDAAEVGDSLSQLGYIARGLGDPRSAETLLTRALAIQEMRLGPADPAVATTLNYLGILYLNLGRLDEAERAYRRALEIRERAPEPDQADIAMSLNNLGRLLMSRGRYDEAVKVEERSLAIRQKVLDADSPRQAVAWNNLAQAYEGVGRLDEADTAYRKALEIYAKVPNFSRRSIARTSTNLAVLDVQRRRFDEAERLLRAALVGSEEADSWRVGRMHWALGNVLRETGRKSEAEASYRKAIDLVAKERPPGDPFLVEVAGDFARLLRATGRESEAAALEARVGGAQPATVDPASAEH